RLPRRVIDHRLIEVGRGDRNGFGKYPRHGAGDDPRAGRRLKQLLRAESADPCGQILGVGVEDEGAEVAVVERGYRTDEQLVCLFHCTLSSFADFADTRMPGRRRTQGQAEWPISDPLDKFYICSYSRVLVNRTEVPPLRRIAAPSGRSVFDIVDQV